MHESGNEDTENTDVPHELVTVTEPLEDVLVASIGVVPSIPAPFVLGTGHKTNQLRVSSPGLTKPDDLKQGSSPAAWWEAANHSDLISAVVADF